MLTRSTRRLTRLAGAGVLALCVSGVVPGGGSGLAGRASLASPESVLAGAAVAASGAPADPVDESKVPHYFGPYPNWANSPLTVSDAAVSIVPAAVSPVSVGNPLIDRAVATDFVTAPGVLAPVFVVLPGAVLPDGTLDSFEVWNQTVLGGGPNASAGNLFHAYVLRPTGTANEFTVVFDSGELTMPTSINPAGEVASFAAGVAVQAGDVIGFYGQGIPVDVGGGTDVLSYPATANPDGVTPQAPALDATLTLGTDPGFPIFPEARTYSFAAVVTPPGAGAGAGRDGDGDGRRQRRGDRADDHRTRAAATRCRRS